MDPKCKKHIRVFYLGIFAIASCSALHIPCPIQQNPVFLPLTSGLDDAFYNRWALQIAHGDFIGREVFHGMPLYPYFLGTAYFIFGCHIFLVKLLQVLLGAVNCSLIYFIGKRTFNKTAGIIAGLFFAFYGMDILYEGLLVGPFLTIFVNAVAILLLMRAVETPKYKYFIFSGVAIGISALNMAGALLFLPLAAVWAFFSVKHIKPVVACVCLVVAALAVIAPVTLRNYLVAGDIVPITSHSGINFYIGNNPAANGTFQPLEGINPSVEKTLAQSAEIAQKAEGRKLKASEVSGYWFKKAFRFIKADPSGYMRLFVRKALLFWNASEIYDVIDYSFVRHMVPILNMPLIGFGLIGPLGLIGMVLAIGVCERRYLRNLLYIFVGTQMLSVLLFFVNSRYRLPVVPYLAVFAGYAVYWWYQKMKAKNILRS